MSEFARPANAVRHVSPAANAQIRSGGAPCAVLSSAHSACWHLHAAQAERPRRPQATTPRLMRERRLRQTRARRRLTPAKLLRMRDYPAAMPERQATQMRERRIPEAPVTPTPELRLAATRELQS